MPSAGAERQHEQPGSRSSNVVPVVLAVAGFCSGLAARHLWRPRQKANTQSTSLQMSLSRQRFQSPHPLHSSSSNLVEDAPTATITSISAARSPSAPATTSTCLATFCPPATNPRAAPAGVASITNCALRHIPSDILQTGPRLISLSLSNNILTSFPSALSLMQALRVLDLSHNLLGSIPPSIGSLPCLEVLNLTANKLGSLPQTLPPTLLKLMASHNSISHLPNPLPPLPALKALCLSHNNLAQLPPSLASITTLERLDVAYNVLTSLPPAITHLYQLTACRATGNLITSIPSDLFLECTALESLSLANNPLNLLQTATMPGFREYAARKHLQLRRKASPPTPTDDATPSPSTNQPGKKPKTFSKAAPATPSGPQRPSSAAPTSTSAPGHQTSTQQPDTPPNPPRGLPAYLQPSSPPHHQPTGSTAPAQATKSAADRPAEGQDKAQQVLQLQRLLLLRQRQAQAAGAIQQSPQQGDSVRDVQQALLRKMKTLIAAKAAKDRELLLLQQQQQQALEV